jgi:hypothetical protein
MPVDILYRTQLLSGSLANANTTPLTPASASTTSGNAVDFGAGGALPAGTSLYGLVARILVLDAHETSGGGTLVFTIDHSSDNSNWATLAGSSRGYNDILTLSATVQTAEIFIEFITHQRYVRLTMTVGTTPVGASVKFDAGLTVAYP